MPKFVPISRASNLFPGNPHPNSIRRWAEKGLGGVKLRTMKFGGKRLTCDEWCSDFCRRVTANSDYELARLQAEAELDEYGI